MKKTKGFAKFVTMMMLAVSIALGTVPVQVHAADPIPKESFDYVYYANANPDVKNAFGTNRDALYKHYVEYGIREGRAAKRISRSRLSAFGKNGEGFDAVQYANAYPDLKAAFGENKGALWNHYVNYGVYEGRRPFANSRSSLAQLMIFDMVETVTTPQMSDREKVKAVHDWIVNNTQYDRRSSHAADTFEITGVMLDHEAVCQGYAYAFDYAMSVLGINCDVVSGYGNGGRHAWNRVFIEGQWLYIDVTWDDPVSRSGKNYLRHDYFLISQAQMNRNHTERHIRPMY